MALDITADQIRAYGIDWEDDTAELMIGDAIALAEATAPGISELSGSAARAAEAIIRGALVRWAESGGNGGVTQEQGTEVMGPYTHTSSRSYSSRKSMFFPTEERALQKLVANLTGRAFSVDLAGGFRPGPCGVCEPGVCLRHDGGYCW